MARKGIHSTDAKRFVRIAQFAGVGLGVLAAALWVMNVPGLSDTLPTKPRAEARLGGSVVTPVAMHAPGIEPDSAAGIQDRLEQALRRVLVAPPTKSTPDKEPPPPPPAPSTGPSWRYLGAIREATRTLALVSINETQKIVSEGATITMTTPEAEGRPESVSYQATVATVQPDYIEIDEGDGKPRRIDLLARSAKVSWVKNMPVTTPGAPMAAGLSAEARLRLATQGIDPAAAERARLAASLAQQAGGAGRNRAAANPTNPNAAPGTTTVVGGRVVTAPASDAASVITAPDASVNKARASESRPRRNPETRN